MIDDLAEFLDHAVRLEANAAEGYAWLAGFMEDEGNIEVAALFGKLGEFSQMHLAETQERYRRLVGELVDVPERVWRWPDATTPESPRAVTPERSMATRQAIQLALGLERDACDFYSAVANQTLNPEVQELAQAFAEEEAEHVGHLERWLKRLDG
ncbi:MAG TPA: ferritin family protein [Xanthomonadaceae bacterium]|nr:ferritin family protein [Xanthomonadaceae bacterium]